MLRSRPRQEGPGRERAGKLGEKWKKEKKRPESEAPGCAVSAEKSAACCWSAPL